MTIDRKVLLSSLKRIMPGIEGSTNVILEGADSFIFSDGLVHSYNDGISISVPMPITDKVGNVVSGVIKAQDFYCLLERFSEPELKLIPKSDRWIVKSSTASAELILLSSTILDRVKGLLSGIGKMKTLPPNFIDALSMCKFSGNKSVMAGAFIKNDSVMGTDEIRIAFNTLETPIAGCFWINDTSVDIVLKADNLKKYCITENWVHFQCEDGSIISCKQLSQDKYPFDKIMSLLETHKKEKGDTSGELPKGLKVAVDRAASLSYTIEAFSAVRLTFSDDGIEVYSERESGKYIEVVKWEKKPSRAIKGLSIFIDPAMIDHALKHSSTFYLKTTIVNDREVTRVIFTHTNGLQLVSTFNGEK